MTRPHELESNESHVRKHHESNSPAWHEVHANRHSDNGSSHHQIAQHTLSMVHDGTLPQLHLNDQSVSPQSAPIDSTKQNSVADTTCKLANTDQWNHGSGLGSPDLGCAASASSVLRQAGVYDGNQNSVYGLEQDLKSKGWTQASAAQPGDVIAGYRTDPANSTGGGAHVGIVGKDGNVYSNDSTTGKWTNDGPVDQFLKSEGFTQAHVLRAPGGAPDHAPGVEVATNAGAGSAPAGHDSGRSASSGGDAPAYHGGSGSSSRPNETAGTGGGGGDSGSGRTATAGDSSAGVPAAGSLSAGEQATASELMKLLVDQYHMSPAGAAAVIGNFTQENGLSTAENSGGLGLGQWIGSRADDLKKFAAEHGLSATSKEAQVGFLMKELSSPEYSGLLHELQTTTDTSSAALHFSQQYERPGDPQNSKREGYALAALQTAGGANLA